MQDAVTVGPLRLDPPLVNGSGVVDLVSSDPAWNVSDGHARQLGAFVTKTVTAEPRTGQPQPWAEVIGPGSLVNAAGLPNPGVRAAMREWQELPGRLGIPVIVSIGGHPGSLPELALQVQAAGWASAIELNLSCPNVDGGLVAADPAAAARTMAAVRLATTLPVFAKLTPACGATGAVARALVDHGADALTCGNTMPIRVAGPDGLPLVGAGLDGGLSGRALHAIALRLVADARAAVDVPIVGLGGVDGTAAVERMRSAGADVIGLGTGVVHDPELIAGVRRLLMREASPARA